VSATTATITGLSGATAYFFEVRAINGAGTLTASSPQISTSTLAQPALALSVSSINFGDIRIGESGTQAFSISNAGNGALSGAVSSNEPWISLSPASFSGSATVLVTANASGLSEGQFAGTVAVASNGGDGTVSVQVRATCVLTKPNPYNLSTGRPLAFFGSGVVPNDTKINIYTLSGDLVATLTEDKGLGEISWDGRNKWGERIVPGIYLYTTVSPTERNAGKFTVVR
jgi:hypothetical protein